MALEKSVEKLLDATMARRGELLKKGIIVLNTNFDDISMEHVFFDINYLASDNNVKEIKLFINSNGGDVFALFPLANLIDSLIGKKTVSTTVMGKAFSCGFLLAICGHKGHRYAFKDSFLLAHEVATDSGYLKNSQNKIDATFTDQLNERLIQIIKEKTKMTRPQIEKYMSSNMDYFMTAKEALKFGVIDKVI